MPSTPMSNKEWEAQDDARSLARAEEIKADKKRLSAAKKQAKKMAIDKQKEASAMKKIARKPVSKKKSGGKKSLFQQTSVRKNVKKSNK